MSSTKRGKDELGSADDNGHHLPPKKVWIEPRDDDRAFVQPEQIAGQDLNILLAPSPDSDSNLEKYRVQASTPKNKELLAMIKLYDHYYSPAGSAGELFDLNNTNGCVYLPSSHLAKTNNKLFIFDEYRTTFDRLINFRENNQWGKDLPPPIIILGTPGIGKTRFLEGLLANELAHGRPTVFYTNSTHFIFTKNGVHMVENSFPYGEEYEGVLALVDVDTAPATMSSLAQMVEAAMHVVQAASPQPRHIQWANQFKPIRFVMERPSVSELVLAMKLHVDIAAAPAQLIRRTIRCFGPNMRTLHVALKPRTVDGSIGMGLDEVIQNVRSAVEQTDPQSLVALIRNGHAAAHSISHALVTSRRVQQRHPNPLRGDTLRHYVTSRFIWRQILIQYVTTARQQLQSLISALGGLPQAASFSGSYFEVYVHAFMLDQPGTLLLHPMTRAKSRLEKSVNSPFSLTPKPGMLPRSFNQKTSTSYTQGTDAYYIPEESNNPTFDAFFRHEDLFIALQMTVAVKHSVEVSGLNLLKKRLGQTKNACFVFVIPQGQDFSCPAPEARWTNLFTFYTLEIPVSSYRIFSNSRFLGDDGVLRDEGDDGMLLNDEGTPLGPDGKPLGEDGRWQDDDDDDVEQPDDQPNL